MPGISSLASIHRYIIVLYMYCIIFTVVQLKSLPIAREHPQYIYIYMYYIYIYMYYIYIYVLLYYLKKKKKTSFNPGTQLEFGA